jgi:hypothetical protein
MLIAVSHSVMANGTDEQRKTGISAGNGGEMGDDGHVAPGGELASMPGGPAKSQKEKPEKKESGPSHLTEMKETPANPSSR